MKTMNRSIALPSVGTQLAVPCFHQVVSSSHGPRGNCMMFSNGMCHLDRGIPNYLLPVAKSLISRNRQNEMRDACSSLPLVAFLASLMEPGGRIDTFEFLRLTLFQSIVDLEIQGCKGCCHVSLVIYMCSCGYFVSRSQCLIAVLVEACNIIWDYISPSYHNAW